tara:strand:- start:1626 stop:1985 length:360 start_codon:yes stop_codon:yes gene_type:complete
MLNNLIKNLNNIKKLFNIIIFIITSSIFIYNFIKNPTNYNQFNQFNKKINIKNKRYVSEKNKKYIASQQKWRCNNCNKLLDFTFEIDHIKPLYKGGSNILLNLQALCPNCHRLKTFYDK